MAPEPLAAHLYTHVRTATKARCELLGQWARLGRSVLSSTGSVNATHVSCNKFKSITACMSPLCRQLRPCGRAAVRSADFVLQHSTWLKYS
jgi:hypothetical protein